MTDQITTPKKRNSGPRKKAKARGALLHDPLTISIEQAMGLAPLGRNKLYEMIADGTLKSSKAGGRRQLVYACFKSVVLGSN